MLSLSLCPTKDLNHWLQRVLITQQHNYTAGNEHYFMVHVYFVPLGDFFAYIHFLFPLPLF